MLDLTANAASTPTIDDTMATPFKRLCMRTSLPSQRSLQQYRLISSSPPSNATPTPQEPLQDNTDLDALTSQPGVSYSITTSPDPPSSLQRFKTMDMASRAHYQLAAHRELREMMRLAAWEMPLLAQHAQTFQPPGKESFLKWRYTTYIDEVHPAARKVVVEFYTHAIPDLTKAQRRKLEKLAGTRLQVGGRVKMSCESFETVAQNKRYLADTINKLVAEAKDGKGDGFEDVPLDTRHQKRRVKLSFPREWRITGERRAELDVKRRLALLGEGRRVEEKRMVSGVEVIDEALEARAKVEEDPFLIEARNMASKGKMGKREMAQIPGRRR